VATYLDDIVAAHRRRAAADGRDAHDLMARAAATAERARGFGQALRAERGLSVIAEVKRRSPSKGDLNPDLDPARVARAYVSGGAACLSVLTDADHFGGSPEDLMAARAATSVPVLRKDFTVDERDVADARLMGADCCLLIAAVLSDALLERCLAVAADVGIDALVETHDEADIERAVAAGATLVGVNQRDLVTFEVDHERALAVVDAIPASCVRVAESGVRGGEDATRLAAAGYDAVLVGEHVVTHDDPRAAVAALKD